MQSAVPFQAAPKHARPAGGCVAPPEAELRTCMRSTLVCTRSSPACRRGEEGRGDAKRNELSTACRGIQPQPHGLAAATVVQHATCSMYAWRAERAHLRHLGLGDVAEVNGLGGARRQRASQVLVHRLCMEGAVADIQLNRNVNWVRGVNTAGLVHRLCGAAGGRHATMK